MKNIYKAKILIVLAIALAIIIIGLSFPSKVTYKATSTSVAIASETPIVENRKEMPKLEPALIPVCACESTGRWNGTPTQYDKNGNVLHGKVNPNDIGMCQINMEARNGHLAQTKKMGLDVYTEAGNIAYANYLYKMNGLKDWGWSKHCWKDHNPL